MNVFKTTTRATAETRERRIKHARKKIFGTSSRPRLSIFRSHKHIYAQIINDEESRTLLSICSFSKELKESIKSGGNLSAAKTAGKKLAEMAIQKGITKIVFDKRWYKYHGRVKAFADSAREGGLKF